MADKWPLANGNWSNAANWNDGTKPDAGDDVFADGKTVTIDEDIEVASLRTTQRSGGTAAGGFHLSGVRTVIGNLIASSTPVIGNTTAGSVIIGNISIGAFNASAFIHSVAGTLTIIGNVNGGGTVGATGARNNSTGTLVIIGNVTAGNAGGAPGIVQSTLGHVEITGNVVGNGGIGVTNSSAGTVTINGTVYGGSGTATSYGVHNSSTGIVTINGDVYGATTVDRAPGVFNASTGRVIVNGDAYARGTAALLAGANNLSFIFLRGNGYASDEGLSPFNGRVLTDSAARVLSLRREVDFLPADERLFFTGGTNVGQPSEADVRFGTLFGQSNEFTGSLRVPGPQYVNAGVLTDDTVGTMQVDLQPILNELDALKTHVTTATQNASQL